VNIKKRGILNSSKTIEREITINWDNFEYIFHYFFYKKMNIAPEEQPLIVSQNFFSSIANIEKMKK
jgi:actin-related protein